MTDVMAVNFFFMASGTRCTRPPVTTRRLGMEGWLNAAHVKELFASITSHRIGA